MYPIAIFYLLKWDYKCSWLSRHSRFCYGSINAQDRGLESIFRDRSGSRFQGYGVGTLLRWLEAPFAGFFGDWYKSPTVDRYHCYYFNTITLGAVRRDSSINSAAPAVSIIPVSGWT